MDGLVSFLVLGSVRGEVVGWMHRVCIMVVVAVLVVAVLVSCLRWCLRCCCRRSCYCYCSDRRCRRATVRAGANCIDAPYLAGHPGFIGYFWLSRRWLLGWVQLSLTLASCARI